MKAYLKKNPEEKGHIIKVYRAPTTGEKRLEVRFAHRVVDAVASDFEILVVDKAAVPVDKT